MKSKIVLIFPIIVLLAVSLACGRESLPVSPPTDQPPLVQPTPTPTGPCVNVFYPFVPGYQWIYQADDGDDSTSDVTKVGLTVSKVEGSQATIDALDMDTGVITHTTADCDNGAIKSYPLLTLGSLFGDVLTGELTFTYVDGVFAPSESDLAAANWATTWAGNYIANGAFTVNEEGETATLTLKDSPVKLDWTLVGKDPVTVQAGAFADAYKVTRRATVDVNVEMEGMNVQATLILDTSQWYAAGTGMVKTVVDSASLRYSGITFPVEIKSRVELVEFRTGQ